MGQAGQQKTATRTYGKTKKRVRKSTAKKQNTPKLKKSIVPGSVLILLGGRFRGRRVVFLKQLESGLLLVTGPFAVNGVPLRRVNQRFCIGTSTKVDLGGADYSKVTDAYFAREAEKKKKKSESSFFEAKPEAKGASDERKAGQKSMDAPLVKALPADIKQYLKVSFALSANQYPHEMKF